MKAVRIVYLGHAGFCIEDDRNFVVMDPWFSEEGAFDSAWFQYPSNRHLADFVRARLADSSRHRYVYISHEHRDHFDIDFLKSLDRNCTLIAPQFRRAGFLEKLNGLGFAELLALPNRSRIALDTGFLQLYSDDSELNRDSALLVRMRDKTFFNMNDCKLFDRLDQVVEDAGSIDVFACQFSGATWHPTCYQYDEPRYAAIAKRKMYAKFESVARAIEQLKPRMYVPSAGPACFLDPELYHLNFQENTIFPGPEKIEWYLGRRLRRVSTEVPLIGPGGTIEMADEPKVVQSGTIIAESARTGALEAYAAAHRELFVAQESVSPQETAAVLLRLRAAFAEKLGHVSIAERVDVPLYFRLRENEDRAVKVDFRQRTATIVRGETDADFYELVAPTWQIRRVLDGELTWEEFALTFRVKIRRNPDAYQPILHAFLLMDAEDLEHWCGMVEALENGRERLTVRNGDREYSIARYCPHQGGDLAQGWFEGGCIVCPRHHWRFDLERGGACTTNGTSIQAVRVGEAPASIHGRIDNQSEGHPSTVMVPGSLIIP